MDFQSIFHPLPWTSKTPSPGFPSNFIATYRGFPSDFIDPSPGFPSDFIDPPPLDFQAILSTLPWISKRFYRPSPGFPSNFIDPPLDFQAILSTLPWISKRFYRPLPWISKRFYRPPPLDFPVSSTPPVQIINAICQLELCLGQGQSVFVARVRNKRR